MLANPVWESPLRMVTCRSQKLLSECDFVWLDLEHSPTNMESLVGHMIALSRGRRPSLSAYHQVKSDGLNAYSTVVPKGSSSSSSFLGDEEIQRFVDACYYPPKGIEGLVHDALRIMADFGGDSYLEQANREIFVYALCRMQSNR